MTRALYVAAGLAILYVTGWLWPVVVGVLILAGILTADIRRAHW
jgi:hypothetical protein